MDGTRSAPDSAPARIAAAGIALAAWIGLAAQLHASVGLTGSFPAAIWAMLRFFTIISNLLVAAAFTGVALGRPLARAPAFLGAVVLAMLLVGVVYMLLLRGLIELSGGALLADLLLHHATPVLVPLWWLAFAPKGGLTSRDPFLWALLPLAYFAYALGRAAIDGVYPYPFMNVARIGWAQTIATAVAMAACFLVAGFVLVRLDRRLGRAP